MLKAKISIGKVEYRTLPLILDCNFSHFREAEMVAIAIIREISPVVSRSSFLRRLSELAKYA